MNERQSQKSSQKKQVAHGQKAGTQNKAVILSQTRLLWILIVLVCAAVLFAHWPVLSAKALSFDDKQYLVDNYAVQNPSASSAKQFLTEVLEPSTVGGYYQPLAMISLMLDCARGGTPENLTPFHLTSLVLHLLNTAIIILILYSLFGRPWVAAIIGLLFGLHPMTVEPIAWVGERKTLLAAFFSLLCLLSYIRYTRFRSFTFYALTFIFFALALMSKPTSTPLPILLLLLDFWPLDRFSKRAITEKIPLFVIAAISALITVISQSRTAVTIMPQHNNAESVFLILCHNVVFYLFKIIYPANLSSHYPFPNPLSAEPMVFIGVLGTLTLMLLLVISLHRTRAALVGWLFFFIAIFPTMGVIGFTNVIASDKYAYLPAVGLLLPLASAVIYLWNTSQFRFPQLRPVLVICVIIAGGLELRAMRNYLAEWKDSQTLINHMLTLAPQAPILHSGMGLFLFEQGKSDEAISHYKEALKLNPLDSETNNNMAIALAEKGQLDEAIAYYNKAIAARANNPSLYSNLGNAFAKQGKLEQAIEQYNKALQLRPRYPAALFNLADTLHKKGMLDEAVKTYNRVIEISPNYFQAYSNLANIFDDQNKPEQAVALYDRALKINPRFAQAHYNAAYTLASHGRISEAINRYSKAIHIDPNYIGAYNNLAILLSQQGRFDEAAKYYEQALKLAPTDFDTRYNFGVALSEAGRGDDAIQQFQFILRSQPRHANAHCRLADLFYRKGLFEQAIAEYQKTLSLDPKHPQAGKALQQIMADRQKR